MYVVRSVDGDEYADDINAIEDATQLPRCPYDGVNWWLAFFDGHPVAYLGLMPSSMGCNCAYLVRVGVLKEHRGNRLQLRMMRVAERFARRNAYEFIVSDTYCNPPSTNNFIRCGYDTFAPPEPWSFPAATYWRKAL